MVVAIHPWFMSALSGGTSDCFGKSSCGSNVVSPNQQITLACLGNRSRRLQLRTGLTRVGGDAKPVQFDAVARAAGRNELIQNRRTRRGGGIGCWGDVMKKAVFSTFG